jgi:hypothetical protein
MAEATGYKPGSHHKTFLIFLILILLLLGDFWY